MINKDVIVVRLTGLVLMLALTGCSSFKPLDVTLKSMIGQDISVLVGALGTPDDEKFIGSNTAYRWNEKSVDRLAGNFILPSPGLVNLDNGDHSFISVSYYCDIRAMVDSNHKISAWYFDGNVGGCSSHIRNLDVL